MNPELKELKEAWAKFVLAVSEALADSLELVFYFLNYVERVFPMNTFDWNKAFPWIVAAIVGLVALFAFKGNTNPAPNPSPWGPAPNVQPNHNPNCPDCFPRTQAEYQALDRLNRLEQAFRVERSAMRREMLRTQLNVAQAAKDIGRTQPMRIPDWLYYQTLPDSYGGGIIGGSDLKSATWGLSPTDNPDYPEPSAAGK